MDVVEKILRDAKMSKEYVDQVVLIGGSTCIPRVQSLLRDFFNGKEVCNTVNPNEAVVYGATIQANIFSGVPSDSLGRLLLCDVCPLYLGLEGANGEMITFIKKNTTVSAEKTETFSTYDDNQSEVLIQVFEGERSMTRDNKYLEN